MTLAIIRAIAPSHDPADPDWAQRTLASILASDHSSHGSVSRRASALAGGVVVAALVTTTAAAAAGLLTPAQLLDAFRDDAGRDIGTIDTPVLVTDFKTPAGGRFALWTATSSTGERCVVVDENWNGVAPTPETTAYGCQPAGTFALGGFFDDAAGPMVYGVAPYAQATRARVTGPGVDTTIEVRPESHGFGTALSGADDVDTVTVTFLDDTGKVLGSETLTVQRD